MNAIENCHHVNVVALLEGRVSDDELTSIESHLNDCSHCQSRLESAANSDGEWRQVASALHTNPVTRTFVSDDTPAGHPPADESNGFAWRHLLSPTDDPQMLGRIGPYEIVGLLGRGGMGIVFKGLDQSLNRFVAIKMMPTEATSSGSARKRFTREAQAAAAIVHEHVMAIHSVSEWQGTPYLVMPYVRGRSLQQRITDEGPLQHRELLRIGSQVASALAAAHSQGLIHRDVKPANILLEQDVERVVLTDFGLARAIDDIGLTQSNTLVGTPQYMSPEQAADQPLDFQTDLFSLGSVLYEMATGRPAFQAVTSYGLLKKINDVDPHPVASLNPDIPDWLITIIERLMAKNPTDRFPSAAEVESLLRQCLSHVEQPHLTPLPESLTESDSPRSAKGTILMLSTAIVTVTVSLAYGMSFFNAPPVADRPDDSPSESVQIALASAERPEPLKKKKKDKEKPNETYTNASQAYSVGATLVRSRDYKKAIPALEAARDLAGDDIRLKMRINGTLLLCYREQPKFELFRDAAEFIIDNHYHDAAQSNMRTTLLSFAVNRGKLDHLVKRYEGMLKEDGDNWLATFVLSQIYAGGPLLRSAPTNPQRAIELIERLDKLEKRRHADPKRNWSSLPTDDLRNPAVPSQRKATVAAQYMKLREYKKAADAYEEAAKLFETTQAANFKDAAQAALKAGDKKRALRLAIAAEQAPPEGRGDQLMYYLHKNLGDIFLELDEPDKAIPHFEFALEKTQIAGYVKSTKASLAEAKEQAASRSQIPR